MNVAKGTITSWSCNPATNGLTTAPNLTRYVLGPGGHAVTELGRDANGNMKWHHTNVWAAGALIATYDSNGLHFYLNDWLGTRRVQTDYAGVVEQTCTSLPYGNGLYCGNSLEFPTENHFTGKQRDSETGNDYFGARYYSSDAGRFLSPDWAAKAEPVPYAYLSNPQSLDLYNYVRDNPLAWLDLNGHSDKGLTCFDSSSMQGGTLVINHNCMPNGQYRPVKAIEIRPEIPEYHPGILTINDQKVPLNHYLNHPKIPSCSAASRVLGYAGDQLSTAGNEMMAMGALAVAGSGVSAFFAPEGAPAEAGGAEVGVQLMEAGGAAKTLGKGLKGYAQGGVVNGVVAAGFSAAVDQLTGRLANRMFPLADAADKKAISKALNPIPEALIGEEVGCGGG